jgi:hypothetical protein
MPESFVEMIVTAAAAFPHPANHNTVARKGVSPLKMNNPRTVNEIK